MPSEPVEASYPQVKSVSLELVDLEPRRAKRGPPRRLTKRVFIQICHDIESGFAATTACELSGVSYRNFRTRVAASSRLAERLKQATDTRAERRREEALAAIVAAGQKSWMAHAWLLERVWPAEFALRNPHRPDSDESPKLEEIPAEVLARHRALLLELARQDEAAQQAKELPAVVEAMADKPPA